MIQLVKNRCWILYFCLFITLAIMSSLKYHNLNTTFFDLGRFLNNFSMIASGQWQSLFLSHVQPFGLFWAIPFLLSFYRLGRNDYLDLSGGIFSFTSSRFIPPLWNNSRPRLFVLLSSLVQRIVRFSYGSSCNSHPIWILFF